jgi:pimeloyl-ACP methyl ester carboxylesterase
MKDFERFEFQGASCRLSALDFGNPDQPDLVMLHGTHDHALGMVTLIDGVQANYHVISPDLRGHGQSDKPGNYTLLALVSDLRALVQQSGLHKPILVAHSLGGNIATRYAALYPDEVSALILLDGLGPPRRPELATASHLAERFRHGVTGSLATENKRRQMRDVEEALQRFRKKNPRVEQDSARFIVEHGTEKHPEGGICWAWDPAIHLVFHTWSPAETETMISLISCPTLLVSGENAPDFWRPISSITPDDGAAFTAELKRRESLFANACSVEIEDAGHMLHYDQPQAVLDAIDAFLAFQVL